MKQGILIYDDSAERFDIRFSSTDYHGGLHCGDGFEVYINDAWIPTRIEMNENWYLVGIKIENLQGLQVRC